MSTEAPTDDVVKEDAATTTERPAAEAPIGNSAVPEPPIIEDLNAETVVEPPKKSKKQKDFDNVRKSEKRSVNEKVKGEDGEEEEEEYEEELGSMYFGDNIGIKGVEDFDNIEIEKIQFHDIDFDLLSSESDITIPSVPSEDNLAFTDFLDKFMDEVPQLEIDIESVRKSSRKSAKDRRTLGADPGHYSDAVTGVVLSSSSESEEKILEETESIEEEEEESEDDYISLPSSDEEVDIVRGPTLQIDDDAFKQFFYAELPTPPERIDYEALASEKELREIKQITQEFLSLLIFRIVKKAEYVDPIEQLRRKIDVAKLMEVFNADLHELEIEQKLKHFVQRKVVDYYRRKKMTRNITEESPDKLEQEMEKVKTAINNLEYLLEKELDHAAAIHDKSNSLNNDLYEIEQQTQEEIRNFENLVIKTIATGRSDRLQKDVAAQLAKLTRLRDEISEVRFGVILKLHHLHSLTTKLNKLESLAPDMRMSSFISMQTEITSLGKKIEERNNELLKTRQRYNSDLHIRTHMREKELMLRREIESKERQLKQLIQKQQEIREVIYYGKLAREKMRKEIQLLNYRSGLLFKVKLMYDYDKTKEKLHLASEKLIELLDRYNFMSRKLHLSSKRFSNLNISIV